MITNIIITAFFIMALYLVELGPFSSEAVEALNGFGTFDMKAYNSDVVHKVLSTMNTESIRVYKFYYLFDFIFIIAFGLFQIMITRAVFGKSMGHNITLAVASVPVVRGILDIIENSIMIFILFKGDQGYGKLINFCSQVTALKLLMIKVWVVLILAGIGVNLFKHMGSVGK